MSTTLTNFAGASSTTCNVVTTASDVVNCGSAASVAISTTTDTMISASCLTSVGGNFDIDGNTNGASNNVLQSILFPLLTYTAGFFQVRNSVANPGNTVLTLLDVHSLAFVGGFIAIFYNSAFTSLTLPALTFVNQYIQFNQNNAITAYNLPALTFVGQYLDVDSNAKISTLTAPALIKIANNGGNAFAVSFCFNNAGFLYSASILHAAAGKPCYLVNCLASTCT